MNFLSESFMLVETYSCVLASSDVTLWRQLVLPSYSIYCPIFWLVIFNRWSFSAPSSCVMFCSFSSSGFSSLFIWPFVGFLRCLFCLFDIFPYSLIVPPVVVFSHLWWSSFVFPRNTLEISPPNITWSSYGRPLMWDSPRRVDSDPLDRVIQPMSFTTTEPFDHPPSERLTIWLDMFKFTLYFRG